MRGCQLPIRRLFPCCRTSQRAWRFGEEDPLGVGKHKNKSPGVMLISFVSASSSRWTLADLLFRYPCGLRRSDLCSGSGLTANRTNQFNASGLYLAFDWVPCSPRPAPCYRALLAFLPSFCRSSVRQICWLPNFSCVSTLAACGR